MTQTSNTCKDKRKDVMTQPEEEAQSASNGGTDCDPRAGNGTKNHDLQTPHEHTPYSEWMAEDQTACSNTPN